MPNEKRKATKADIPMINSFITRASRDNCLTCPVTGDRFQS